MSNFLKKISVNNFSIILIFILVFSRLIPHPPNFTPIISASIISGYLFKKINISLFIVLSSMILSDLFIGFHKTIFFTYLSLFTIIIIFSKINNIINKKNLFLFGLAGSLIFFLISNFGVWLIGDIYEKNLTGLLSCYILAIPFLKNSILSTIIFLYLAFWASSKHPNVLKLKN
jgi:hypothetical protein